MPFMLKMWLALSPSLKALMIGMPPATLASKPNGVFLAKFCKAYLWYAKSALFAVTTAFLRFKISLTTLKGSSTPPISSTKTSISSRFMTLFISSVKGMPASLFLFKFLTTPMTGTISSPHLAAISFLFFSKIFATDSPTVPTPKIATFIQILSNIFLYFLLLVLSCFRFR